MSPRTGYSLLEVIVAFVVLTLALTTIIPALGTGLVAVATAEKRWVATELATSLLAKESKLAAAGISSNRSGVWADDYKWRLQNDPYIIAAAGVERSGTFVLLTVTITDQNERTLSRLSTIIRAPANE